MALLEASGIGKNFGDTKVLKDISLTLEQGEALAVRLCEAAAKRIAPFTDGYYIMTPFQRVGLVCRVMRATRNLAE